VLRRHGRFPPVHERVSAHLHRTVSMRRVSFGMIVLLGATLFGCGGQGADSGRMAPRRPPPRAPVKCSDAPPQPDEIVMRCGIRLKPDTWQIDVVIGAHAAT